MEFPTAYPARIGGDEFIILLLEPFSRQTIIDKMCNLSLGISNNLPSEIDGLSVTISAGVATTKDLSLATDDLIKYADIALYNTKRTKKGACSFYNEIQPI